MESTDYGLRNRALLAPCTPQECLARQKTIAGVACVPGDAADVQELLQGVGALALKTRGNVACARI